MYNSVENLRKNNKQYTHHDAFFQHKVRHNCEIWLITFIDSFDLIIASQVAGFRANRHILLLLKTTARTVAVEEGKAFAK